MNTDKIDKIREKGLLKHTDITYEGHFMEEYQYEGKKYIIVCEEVDE